MDIACIDGYIHNWVSGSQRTWCSKCWVGAASPKEKKKRAPHGSSMRQKLTYLIRRDGAYCHYCLVSFESLDGVTNRATVDHVIPRRHGGTHAFDNLVPACRRCNNAKGDMEYYAFFAMVRNEGWRPIPVPVKPKREPEELPSFVLRVSRDDKRW